MLSQPLESDNGDSTTERYSSTDDSVEVTIAALAVGAAATAAVEVANPAPLCQLGRGSLTTLPPVVHPTTTRAAAASAAAATEAAGGGVAEATGGVNSDDSHSLQFESPLYASVFSPFFLEVRHYP
jgi:hypothetical protein